MLINIDYLIINLSGKKIIENKGNFKLEKKERGTKIFQNVHEISYKNLSLGTLLSEPYENSVLKWDFKQFQFNNPLFYIISKEQLKSILYEFLLTYELTYDGINRLDICLDHKENDNHKELFSNLLNKKILLSGREKAVTPYYISNNGAMEMTGITIGKRSNSRFLRIYNKTLALEKEPKQYIKDWHSINGLNSTVWRFEYQLNNKFFKDMFRSENGVNENIIWSIFNSSYLLSLIELAKKNHFELRENTGKTEVNKEKEIDFVDFQEVKNVSNQQTHIVKIVEKFENKIIVIKRTVKSLFSEYYKSFQELEFIIPLQKLLDKYDLNTWFHEKMNLYLAEFRTKEHLKEEFDKEQFYNDLAICI